LQLFLVVAIFCLQYFGCSDSSNISSTSQKINVYGKVIGGVFNYGYPNVKVRIENKEVYTDIYGNFIVNDVQVPYDVYICDSVTKKGSAFKNLTTSRCWLPHLFNFSGNIPEATINVTLGDNLKNSYESKVFFTDGRNINGIGNGHCIVKISDNSSVIGKVCVLLYTKDNSDNIISYDKFGFMDNVTVSPNDNLNLSFPDSIMTYNPAEVAVTGTISGIPTNSSIYYEFYMISMSPRKANYFSTDCSMYNNLLNSNSFSFLIPSGLPVSYYPIYHIMYADTNYSSALTGAEIYLLPKTGSTNLNIAIHPPAQIISPAELTRIDTNTVFTYSASGSNKIYHIIINDSINEFHIYTVSENITTQNLWKFGLGNLSPNYTIKVSIGTGGSFSSLDDYVNPDYENVVGYGTIPVSKKYIVNP